MKTLLIFGNDRISKVIIKKIQRVEFLLICIDTSISLKRIYRLLKRGSLSFALFLKMLICELSRPKVVAEQNYPKIRSNLDLLMLVKELRPNRIILFRAGLIVSKELIDCGIPIFNVHAADVNNYGGIGAIARAISKRDFEQFACLHRVTTTIDRGEIIDRESYNLDPNASYCENETTAYAAAARLLIRQITPIQ